MINKKRLEAKNEAIKELHCKYCSMVNLCFEEGTKDYNANNKECKEHLRLYINDKQYKKEFNAINENY